jgi:hypothetical protein
MRCPGCQAEFIQAPKYCSECGRPVSSSRDGEASRPLAARDESLGLDKTALRPPSGFSRTLSTEFVGRQAALRTWAQLSGLMQNQTFRPGDILIHKGETKRDLYILTEGTVEISRKEGDEELVLNEIAPPYILGEIAFLFGMPRTATARAKTEVKAFVLKYEDLQELLRELPPWLPSLLTSLASGIKSLHHKVQTLEKSVMEATAQRA